MRTLAAVSFFCVVACAMATYYDYNAPIVASAPITYAINEPVSYVRKYAAPTYTYVAPAAPAYTTAYVQKAAAPVAYTYGNPYAYGYGGYGYPYGFYKK